MDGAVQAVGGVKPMRLLRVLVYVDYNLRRCPRYLERSEHCYVGKKRFL